MEHHALETSTTLSLKGTKSNSSRRQEKRRDDNPLKPGQYDSLSRPALNYNTDQLPTGARFTSPSMPRCRLDIGGAMKNKNISNLLPVNECSWFRRSSVGSTIPSRSRRYRMIAGFVHHDAVSVDLPGLFNDPAAE